MATVRITTNWQHPDKMEWIGAVEIDKKGVLKRSAQIPPEAYALIESAIAAGRIEGDVYAAEGARFHWFLDR
jgi:hypothetical protein